jgi:bromodomain adjacent to zinc finger domain protein 1A
MDILSGNKEPEENKEAVAEVNGNGANAGSDDEGEKKSSSDGQSDGRGSADPQSSKGGWTVLPAVRTHAAQRKIEREKIARDKAAQAEYRKLDEELSKHDRRMEGIEAEFRNLLGVARARPIGKDRFYNKVWWLDGLGGSSLVTSGGVIAYGSGRIFIQGPSELDWEVLERREAADHDVMVRMREDLGEEGVMGVSEWGYFSDPDEVSSSISFNDCRLSASVRGTFELVQPQGQARTPVEEPPGIVEALHCGWHEEEDPGPSDPT